MTGDSTVNNSVNEMYPYLRTSDGNAAIEFYKQAFGATEEFRLAEPSGRVGHAELKFGDRTIMVSDAYPDFGIHGPQEGVPTGFAIHLHVADVDAMTQQAVDAGATLIMEPTDQLQGERASRLRDPFGHEWLLGSQIEEVSREEMQRRFAAMFGG